MRSRQLKLATASVLGLYFLGCAILAQAQEPDLPRLPVLSAEVYPLPDNGSDAAELGKLLSRQTGVRDTHAVGVRVRVEMPPGYKFQGLSGSFADAVLLVPEDSMWKASGRFLQSVLRFLLLGQIVSAAQPLEIPLEMWMLFFNGDPRGEGSVTLQSSTKLELNRGDSRVTDHGDYVVLRILVGTNSVSELVGIEIEATQFKTGNQAWFRVGHLPLPTEALANAATAGAR
jgi:hypothetical protein